MVLSAMLFVLWGLVYAWAYVREWPQKQANFYATLWVVSSVGLVVEKV